jgi:tripeptide aminopeptidase
MNVTDLFLRYATFDTRSDDSSASVPSTEGQRIFAQELAGQLREMGMSEVSLDENGYLMATLPASASAVAPPSEEGVPSSPEDETAPDRAPVTGFIAHLDTSPDLSGRNVRPRIVHYRGGDIVLDEARQIVLSPAMFPEMKDYIDQDLIVTDGATLLGADDKAGIAAIVAAMSDLLEHPEIRHGKVRIAFTPDEEIGRGADHFDVERFGCHWAYTVDGGAIGELEYETFNAASARIVIKGRNIHPGYARHKMHNALQTAFRFHGAIPAEQCPEKTEGYEGFYHLVSLAGTVEEAVLSYLIRDHDRASFEARKTLIASVAQRLRREAEAEIAVEMRDQYSNMREKIEPYREMITIAGEAMRACGVKPLIRPVRGGTDGARLSFMGLPCPNIFAGGVNFHGRYEYLPIRSLEKCRDTILHIIRLMYAR